MKWALCLLGFCISWGVWGCQGNVYKQYSIITERPETDHARVERLLVTAQVDSSLIPTYAHSLEHSLVSAFKDNGVEAVVNTVASPGPDKIANPNQETGEFSPDALLHISIRPVYRARKDGLQAIVSAEFEVSLMDTAMTTQQWHGTGKLWQYKELLIPLSPNHRKEMAFNTTRAIVSVFITEVNGQVPSRIRTVLEDRTRHGDRVD